MGKTLVITHHKGGTGKTSSVLNIGAILAKKGYKTLLIDLDAQANLTTILTGGRLPDRTLFEALTDRDKLPFYRIRETLYLCPSSVDMVGAEALIHKIPQEERGRILRDLIEPVKTKFDYILLDCPPNLGHVTTGALLSADQLYIVLPPEYIPLTGLKDFVEALTIINAHNRSAVKIDGVIVSRFSSRRVSHRTLLRIIQRDFGDKVFKSVIRDCTKIAESPIDLTDVVSYAPTSIGAKDYTDITEEILERTAEK